MEGACGYHYVKNASKGEHRPHGVRGYNFSSCGWIQVWCFEPSRYFHSPVGMDFRVGRASDGSRDPSAMGECCFPRS